MKNTTKKDQGKSLRLLRLFCIVVGIAILGSLGLRMVNLVRASQFDGSHQFIIAFVYQNSIDLIQLNPTQKKSSHLRVTGAKDLGDARSKLPLPADTIVRLSKPLSDPSDAARYFFWTALYNGGTTTTLSIYDRIRLGIIALQSPLDSSETVNVSDDSAKNEQEITQLLVDQDLVNENKSITITNASGFPGLGVRLEKALSVLGGTVIAVNNGDVIQPTSEVRYSGEKSYTVTRLSKLIHVTPLKEESSGLSDIIITIGKDKGGESF